MQGAWAQAPGTSLFRGVTRRLASQAHAPYNPRVSPDKNRLGGWVQPPYKRHINV